MAEGMDQGSKEGKSREARLGMKIKTAFCDNQRSWDLLRFCRHALHTEGLISNEEFSLLVFDHPAVSRLESYDSAVAAEREACARIAKERKATAWGCSAAYLEGQVDAADAIAAAIRARGKA